MNSLDQRVMNALDQVIDPCSVTAGAPLSVVDMGLVSDVAVDGEGRVSLRLRATSAMCTMIAGMMKDVEQRLAQVQGVTTVHVTLHGGSIWSEADMTEKGRSALAARRQRSRTEVAVRPHEWKSRRQPSPQPAEPTAGGR